LLRQQTIMWEIRYANEQFTSIWVVTPLFCLCLPRTMANPIQRSKRVDKANKEARSCNWYSERGRTSKARNH